MHPRRITRRCRRRHVRYAVRRCELCGSQGGRFLGRTTHMSSASGPFLQSTISITLLPVDPPASRGAQRALELPTLQSKERPSNVRTSGVTVNTICKVKSSKLTLIGHPGKAVESLVHQTTVVQQSIPTHQWPAPTLPPRCPSIFWEVARLQTQGIASRFSR